ncbi:MAG: hypothetical protein MJK04_19125 [Psychrosphaera sp.]|nr:hypothetical protein [Psychrosphaera sp.]
MSLVASPNLMAKTDISHTELTRLTEQHYPQLTQDLLGMTPDAINRQLAIYSPVKQIWLKKRLIEQLRRQTRPANTQPTLAQKEWIGQQMDSEQVLFTPFIESGHERPFAVVNIAAQAKGLLAHWQAIETAEDWLTLVAQKQFECPNIIAQTTLLGRPKTAIQYFVQHLSPGQFSDLVDQLLTAQSNKIPPSNLLLASLAKSAHASQYPAQQQHLYQWLWSKPADEFSIAALQSVINNPIEADNIQQLKRAAYNSSLSSLSLNLMAKNYGNNPQVVDYLFGLLDKKGKSSLAAAALAKIDNSAVKQRLSQGIYSPDNQIRKASQLALLLSVTAKKGASASNEESDK